MPAACSSSTRTEGSSRTSEYSGAREKRKSGTRTLVARAPRLLDVVTTLEHLIQHSDTDDVLAALEDAPPGLNAFHAELAEQLTRAEVNRAELIAAAERAQVYVGRDDSPRVTLEWEGHAHRLFTEPRQG